MQAGVPFAERELRSQPLSVDELRGLLQERPASLLYAKRGRQNRALGIDPERLSDEEMLSLMAREPALIRRPTLVVDGEVIPQPSRQQLEAIAAAATGLSLKEPSEG